MSDAAAAARMSTSRLPDPSRFSKSENIDQRRHKDSRSRLSDIGPLPSP